MNENSNKEPEKVREGKAFWKRRTPYAIGILAVIASLALVSFVLDIRKENDEKQDANMEEQEKILTVYGERTKEELVEELKHTIVQIQAEIPSVDGKTDLLTGSGVILTITDGYVDIVTASHVVESTAAPLVFFADGSLAYGSVLAYGKESDIAFVRVTKENFAEGIGTQLQAVKCEDVEGYTGLIREEEVLYIGSASGVAEDVKTGILTDKEQFVELFQNDMLVCSANVSGGMSGCGTFHRTGSLIGILVGTNGKEAVSVAVPDVTAEYRSVSQ